MTEISTPRTTLLYDYTNKISIKYKNIDICLTDIGLMREHKIFQKNKQILNYRQNKTTISNH